MQFQRATVKGVKADIAAGNITISLSVPLEDLETAEELAHYAGKNAIAMKINITPHQPSLFAERKDDE